MEYLLILTLAVSICLIILGFNMGFQSWASNYFGEYFDCLIRSGELPSLGAPIQGSARATCEAKYERFTWTKGRPPVSSSNSAGNRLGRRRDGVTKRRGRGRQGGGTSSIGGIGSQRRGGGRQKILQAQSGSEEAGDEDVGEEFLSPKRRGLRILKRRKRTGGEGVVEIPIPKTAVDENKMEKNRGKEQSKIDIPKKRRKNVAVVPIRKVAAKKQDDLGIDDGFDIDFAFILKFFIIAGFFIGLFLLIGGQVLRITKDSE